MATLGAALASLAISAALITAIPDGETYPIWQAIALWTFIVSVVFGVGLFCLGLSSRVSLVDVEESWNIDYDRLRNASAQFVNEIVSSVFPSIQSKYPDIAKNDTWEHSAINVPIPKVINGALNIWGDIIANHNEPRVRFFFELARACESIKQGSEYRRLAIRTYDIFWRSRETKSGFREWMDQEEVRAGAEPLIVILAYMEVARACQVKFGRTPTHLGFWSLAEEWHPNTLS